VTNATPDEFARAIERAARAAGPDDPALADPLVREAYALVRARIEGREAEPCPADVLARVDGLFAARPRGKVGALLALVFDSDAAPALAVRGVGRPERVLRYAGEGATVDFQVRAAADGDRRLYVAVNPAVPGMVFEIRALPHGSSRRSTLDASGVGEVEIPWRARCASAAFHVGSGEAFRIESIDLG
jgi:hypothetical protein